MLPPQPAEFQTLIFRVGAADPGSCEGCDCVSRGDRVCCGSGFARTRGCGL